MQSLIYKADRSGIRSIFSRRKARTWFLIAGLAFSGIFPSCKTDPYGSHWEGEGNLTICEFLKLNRNEYSKSYRLLTEGKLLNTLCAYNPYGEGYTLFLPTDDAIDRFISQNPGYTSFEEMVQDTGHIRQFVRYHVLKRKVHTDEFPYGAFPDSTLTGDRLSVGFYTSGDSRIIKINNQSPITRANMNMTNGFIHVVSEVLQKSEIPGYEWLQQQEGYTILAKAMQLSQIKSRLGQNKYTLFAEHDSIYNRKGIFTAEELVKRIASKGTPITNVANNFYKFVGYHIIGGEYYLNDFHWGSRKYQTFGNVLLTIEVGMDIKINPGTDLYGYNISVSGDTTEVRHISPVLEDCNIMTKTGPVHSISEILYYLPFPVQGF